MINGTKYITVEDLIPNLRQMNLLATQAFDFRNFPVLLNVNSHMSGGSQRARKRLKLSLFGRLSGFNHQNITTLAVAFSAWR